MRLKRGKKEKPPHEKKEESSGVPARRGEEKKRPGGRTLRVTEIDLVKAEKEHPHQPGRQADKRGGGGGGGGGGGKSAQKPEKRTIGPLPQKTGKGPLTQKTDAKEGNPRAETIFVANHVKDRKNAR